jgi:DNA polymerase elongation subunit (family B)
MNDVMKRKTFFSYSWNCEILNEVEEEDFTKQTIITIYGLDVNNKNVCVRVTDFDPYVYIELPQELKWDTSMVRLLHAKLTEICERRDDEINFVTAKLEYRKKLYYANLDDKLKPKYYPFLYCTFKSLEDSRKLKMKIRNPIYVTGIGKIKLKLHQDDDPILQLTSIKGIPPTGWIDFEGKKIKDKKTYCDYEYEVSWKNLHLNKERSDVAKPLILSIDLEVNSTIPTSMPKPHREGDKIFQCSCVLARQGDKENSYEKYILCLGDVDKDKLDPGIIPLCYKTESQLLLGLKEFIVNKQPNIIIGYNIFGFDIDYMINRMDPKNDTTGHLSSIYQDFTKITFVKEKQAKQKIISWSSSAFKNQEFKCLDAEGRIFIDLLPIVKRDLKLGNYSLKTVSTAILKNVTKDPLNAQAIFKCYTLGRKGDSIGKKALSICANYCIKDSLLVLKLFETLTTWFALCEMSKVCNVEIFKLFTQGQQLKVFSQVYRKCTGENTVVEKDGYISKEGEHFMGATVIDPIPGIYDCILPFDFNSLYPTSIIANNISWDTLVLDDNVPDSACNILEWDCHNWCEHDKKVERYNKLLSMIEEKKIESKEITKQKKLKKNIHRMEEFKEKSEEINLILKRLRNEKNSLKKTRPKHSICKKYKYRWLKTPMGILPEILTHLLDTRKATKNLMKTVKKDMEELKKGLVVDSKKIDELEIYYNVLDQRQTALKVSANSAYGALGVKKGYLPFPPGANCTTYYGRTCIEKASHAITEDYKGILIYGDTDSNYVGFPHLKTPQENWNHAVMVSQEVSKLFPRPMALAFEEKIYWRFFILTKKRYMSLLCDKDGKISGDINKKGVILQRRDNCDFVRKVYSEIVMMVFDRDPLNNILEFLVDKINDMFCLKYNFEDFVITKSVGDTGGLLVKEEYDEEKKKTVYKIGDYKIREKLSEDENKRKAQFLKKNVNNEKDYYISLLPPQAQLAEKMKSRGQIVSAGSRIEYVITDKDGHEANQSDKIESFQYFLKHKSVLKIDHLHYLKQLVNPVDQILDILFRIEERQDYKNVKFNPSKCFVLNQYKLHLKKQKYLEHIKRLSQPEIIIKGKKS